MNIFNGIIHLENNVTRILYNLLNYKIFRNEFCQFLGIDEEIEYGDIYTQEVLKIDDCNYGDIDLQIKATEKIYLIEIKTNYYTELSPHQNKYNYEKYCAKIKETGKVFYLIPKLYRHKHHFENAIIKYDSEIKYWEDFLKILKEKEISKFNSFVNHFVESLTNYWLIDIEVEFSQVELNLLNPKLKGMPMQIDMCNNSTVPEMLLKLFDMIDNIKSSIQYKTNRSSVSNSDYGFDITYNEKDDKSVWFGCDFDVWKDRGFPIILWLDIDKKLHQYFLANNYEEYEYEDEKKLIYHFNLDKKTIELDELKKELEEQLSFIKKI